MWTEDPPSFEGEYYSITGAAAPPLAEVVPAAEGAGRDPGSIQTGITIERPLPETDAESSEALDQIAQWGEAGVDHFVMDFGNPMSTEPILWFSEQVITPRRSG
jgi:alkanesulfonate monooxygenase SsuD/methylene tetrahydromethanopterin reductase-like flavin-dependent oxidoreductase (luciferase family)